MEKEITIVHQTKNRVRFRCAMPDKQTDAKALEKKLSQIEGVKHVRINKKTHSIVVEYSDNITVDTIREILGTIDWESLKLDENSLTSQIHCISDEEPSRRGIYRASSALIAERFVSGDTTKMALSTAAALPLLKDGTVELFTEGLTSRVLEATAVGVSLARKDYFAANGTNVMLELGEYIEETTVHKSDDLIKELAKPNIKEVWIEVDDHGRKELKQVPYETLKIGDVVVAGAGETIPVDGHIVEGEALVNQASMTGESEAVFKEIGNRVLSGTVVEDGRIKIWAENVGEDTATARIKEYIATTLNEKSSIGLKATRLADKLVPVTLGLAGTAYVISKDWERVASVLQADYSCALKLATPVAFKTAIAQAGKNGILIKGAKSIEALNAADTFIFDKTGTLTYGELEVESVKSFDDKWSKEDVLNLAASAEEHYFHPVAEAVVNAAKAKGFKHIHHEEVKFIVAHGLKTTVEGKEVLIGSRHFLEDDEGIDFSKHDKEIEKCLIDGKSILYIAYDKKLLGTIGMRDKVRENTKETISRLRESGAKEIVMLTGDIEEKANALAAQLGIDTVYANMQPTDKAKIVKQYKDKGKRVAFVGDGINDAPALISADVGISMSKGADIAKATADVALLRNDIAAVYEAKEISMKTMDLIEANFNTTVGINSIILAGATLGFFSPLTTAVLHNGTTIGLLANSMKKI